MSEKVVINLKNEGDVAFASANYQHALNCYSKALNELSQRFEIDSQSGVRSFLSPEVFELEVNLLNKRSVVYVKIGSYKYALDDAKLIVNIRPMWFKGYLRVGDVHMILGSYEAALKFYQLALRYLDTEENEKYENFINTKIRDVLARLQNQRIFDYQIPWIGAALGLVIGMALVTWDYVSHPKNGYLQHPILKLVTIASCSFLCFYFAQVQRNWNRESKRLIFDVQKKQEGEEEEEEDVNQNEDVLDEKVKKNQ